MAIYDNDYSVEDMEEIADDVQRMEYIAPNLSALVGSIVAAKLVRAAGCLNTLARMKPNNVLQPGRYFGKKTETSGKRVAYLESTELFSSTPPESKRICRRLLAAKSALAARVDCTGQDPTGKSGRKLRELIIRKLNLSC